MILNNVDYVLTTAYLLGSLDYHAKHNIPMSAIEIQELIDTTKEMFQNKNSELCIEYQK